MPFRPQPNNNSFWGEIWENLPYFFSRSRPLFLAQRQQLWQEHVNTYARLRHGAESEPAAWGTTRVDTLTVNLDIIDRKFSAVLQFQGLLAVAVSIGAAVFRESLTAHWLLEGLIALFALLWFVTFFMCIRAVGRLFWGDLWHDKELEQVEQMHVNNMILCVIRRTARYRLAVLLALSNSVTLLALLLVVFFIY
jgi:hypothetical protein